MVWSHTDVLVGGELIATFDSNGLHFYLNGWTGSLRVQTGYERDPEMHRTRKGNQWHFGAKAHIGVDSKSGAVHSVCTSAASVSDVHMLPDLLHGNEKKVWGDGGYHGQTEVIREAAPAAQDMTNRRAKNNKGEVNEEERRKNRNKSRCGRRPSGHFAS